jgi:hypothetical protein
VTSRCYDRRLPIFCRTATWTRGDLIASGLTKKGAIHRIKTQRINTLVIVTVASRRDLGSTAINPCQSHRDAIGLIDHVLPGGMAIGLFTHLPVASLCDCALLKSNREQVCKYTGHLYLKAKIPGNYCPGSLLLKTDKSLHLDHFQCLNFSSLCHRDDINSRVECITETVSLIG